MSEPSDHFDGLYTNWLRARAECVHPPETAMVKAKRSERRSRPETKPRASFS